MLQPDHGFRFSVDSLLLSVFITPKYRSMVQDLGCGCGVVGLGLLLANTEKEVRLLGVDNDPEMVTCAMQNSKRLGLEHMTQFLHMSAAEIITSRSINPESMDLVLINPPYRRPGTGRIPENKSKKAATFVPDTGLEDFFKAAFFALKNKGKAGIVYPASRLNELLSGLDFYQLRPKRILPVQGRLERPASLVLVQAVKNAGREMVLLPPLVLYDSQNQLTREAGNLCPYLKSNPVRNHKPTGR